MWKFLRVDITDINPSVARETFSETELENLANLIIEMGGIIRPAILKKADNKKVDERYNIISGDLEYYASVIANKKVPDIEMINAFVVDKEGNITNVKAENNPGYGTMEEAIRVLKNGPKWVPASQNGENVIYRQRQAIVFGVSYNY